MPDPIIAIGQTGGRHTYRLRPLENGRWLLYSIRPAAGTAYRTPREWVLHTLSARDLDEATVMAVAHIHDPEIFWLSDLAGTVSRDPAAWRFE